MRESNRLAMVAALTALGLAVAACGGGTTATTVVVPAVTAAPTGTDAPNTTAAVATLADVCPDPIVIQTDWFPESEHGAMYQLVGDDYTVDIEKKVVRGSLMASGEDTGIDIEVRTGGPAIGFAAVSAYMYTDDSVTLGYVNTDLQVSEWPSAPLLAVVAPLEKNPQIIMWDPETYPDVKTIADVGTEGIIVNLFSTVGFPAVFVAQGIWTADQLDPSYNGSPAVFISQGDIAQQGFASAEPYNYKNVYEEYGRDVAYQLIHDAGFQIYSQVLGIRPADLDGLRPCLEQFVPIVQQATVDFYANPGRANAIIVDTVDQFNDFWVYDQGLADFSVATQLELGLAGNGPDSVVGNMDLVRVQSIIDAMRGAGMDVADITADDIATNEFIDDSIGFPG